MVGLTKHGERELLHVHTKVTQTIIGDAKLSKFLERTKPALMAHMRNYARSPTYPHLCKLSDYIMISCPVRDGRFIPDQIDVLMRNIDYVHGFQICDALDVMSDDGCPWED